MIKIKENESEKYETENEKREGKKEKKPFSILAHSETFDRK